MDTRDNMDDFVTSIRESTLDADSFVAQDISSDASKTIVAGSVGITPEEIQDRVDKSPYLIAV